MKHNLELCASFLKCVFEFQTLLAGALAILAAFLSARALWKTAKLPIERQEKYDKKMDDRRLQYLRSILSTDLRLLSTRAKQAESTVITYKASNASVNDDTRKKTILKFPIIIDNWEFMSLLPNEIFNEIMDLRRKVDDHNFDMLRAGGAFGDDNFGAQICKRAISIQNQSMELSNKIWNNFETKPSAA
jgi:hypothetical protein